MLNKIKTSIFHGLTVIQLFIIAFIAYMNYWNYEILVKNNNEHITFNVICINLFLLIPIFGMCFVMAEMMKNENF